MRIVSFVDEFPPFFRGGLGTYAMEISRQFIRRGHSLTVFSRNRGNDAASGTWEGADVHRPLLADCSDIFGFFNPDEMRTWGSDGQQFYAETMQYNLLSASALISALVRQESCTDDRTLSRDWLATPVGAISCTYDLLVAHDWLAAPAGIVARRNLHLPLVVHFHSTEQGRNPAGSQTIRDIERLSATIADRVVTVSVAMRDELVRLGYPAQKIEVIYNGVDEEKYDPSRFSAQRIEAFRDGIGVGEAPMIFFIGRLTAVKGPDSLLSAMSRIVRKVPTAKLVIVGIGEMEEQLRRMVHELHLEEHVLLHCRMVPEEERLLYYAAADVAVFPSRYEPFGIVCTEAMSMGIPVVVGARGTSGLREQVVPSGDGICGYHINPHDPGDIAEYVVDILQHPVLAARMGRNGRDRVTGNFTWEIAAEKTERVYQDLLDAER